MCPFSVAPWVCVCGEGECFRSMDFRILMIIFTSTVNMIREACTKQGQDQLQSILADAVFDPAPWAERYGCNIWGLLQSHLRRHHCLISTYSFCDESVSAGVGAQIGPESTVPCCLVRHAKHSASCHALHKCFLLQIKQLHLTRPQLCL